MPQLRKNIITGEWLILAPERARRPDDYIRSGRMKRSDKSKCPFCPGGEAFKNSIKDAETENIYVVPNKYPAFVTSINGNDSKSYRVEDSFYFVKHALGGHEVINIKNHDLEPFQFSTSLTQELFEVFQNRYLFYKKDKINEYAMAIYNHGPESGATLDHPHAQLFVSSIVPNYILRELHGSENYYNTNGSCVFCDMVKHEHHERVRVLAENDDFILFTFFAARFPFEMWVLPKQHESQFEKVGKDVLKNLAIILNKVFVMLDKTLNDPPFNFFIHNLPNTMKSCSFYHWHIEITPRLSNYGGYELGSGNVIDIVAPEKAAEFLKKE